LPIGKRHGVWGRLGPTDVSPVDDPVGRFRGNVSATRCGDHDLRGVVQRDCEAAFVDQAVVEAAEEDEVLQRRLAAVEPVVDVVAVQEAGGGAAGEAARAVADPEGAADGWGDGAGAAADVEDVAVVIEGGGDKAGVAADPAS